MMHQRIAHRYMQAGPRRLFHATSIRGIKNILSRFELGSEEKMRVSFSEVPLMDFAGQVLAFSGSIASRLIQIKYNFKWFYQHPEMAEYVIEDDFYPEADPFEDPQGYRREMAREATNYSYEREWVSKGNHFKFKPSELQAVLTDRVANIERLEAVVSDYPSLAHVQVGVLS